VSCSAGRRKETRVGEGRQELLHGGQTTRARKKKELAKEKKKKKKRNAGV
jgi:hypothetical protein